MMTIIAVNNMVIVRMRYCLSPHAGHGDNYDGENDQSYGDDDEYGDDYNYNGCDKCYYVPSLSSVQIPG